ncbi:glutamine amidotransferase [Agromyces sp. Root81]|uniref:type 1 glutamine amidotransferase n=1 Tax=Agromyces sp. Root81 TaxID=1736601 RepID=UPI0006FC5F55|nr:type 1 glutamine amidotransferase [Agromyces sp. Root81]KRC61386.1 glutamine amidotransferase [Agromyces sp. Root81]
MVTADDGPKVLVVVNSRPSSLRRMRPWLEDSGLELVVAYGDEGLPERLGSFDGLIMLGGGLMPDDDDRAPWLARERELAAEAIAGDIPTLGVCLGAQILAHVAGGEVRAAYGIPERGATPVFVTEQGGDDPVLSPLGPVAHVIENHEDMITRLPDAAVLLASSEACVNQAFRLGRHVRGVQFHPEAGARDLEKWDDAALAAAGLDKQQLVDAALEYEDESADRCARLATAFAAEVVASRVARVA